jgi:hypothetical protein
VMVILSGPSTKFVCGWETSFGQERTYFFVSQSKSQTQSAKSSQNTLPNEKGSPARLNRILQSRHSTKPSAL